MFDGDEGSPPPWAVHIMVAKWLGVAPWDLGQVPVAWKQMAMELMAAEKRRARLEAGR